MKLIGETWKEFPSTSSRQRATYGKFECEKCGDIQTLRTTSKCTNPGRFCHSCTTSNRVKRHGLSKHLLYPTWRGMKARCYNPKATGYKNYGGRGITIYSEWLTSPKAYFDYVSTLPDALLDNYTLDRIDNEGNYEPGNLRWASKSTQCTNIRDKGNKGVSKAYMRKDGTQTYQVSICHDKHHKYLGVFEDVKKAKEARLEYIKKHGLPHNS